MSGIRTAALPPFLWHATARLARASPFILRKCGGHGASPRSGLFVARGKFEQLFERTGDGVDVGVRIANFIETLRHSERR